MHPFPCSCMIFRFKMFSLFSAVLFSLPDTHSCIAETDSIIQILRKCYKINEQCSVLETKIHMSLKQKPYPFQKFNAFHFRLVEINGIHMQGTYTSEHPNCRRKHLVAYTATAQVFEICPRSNRSIQTDVECIIIEL